jgi:hypothetical protein
MPAAQRTRLALDHEAIVFGPEPGIGFVMSHVASSFEVEVASMRHNVVAARGGVQSQVAMGAINRENERSR